MSSYVETIIGPNERVVYVGKVSAVSILGSIIGGMIVILFGVGMVAATGPIGGVIVGVGVLWIVAAVIKRMSTELAVTSRRVIAKFGFIRRSTVEINLGKVESVRVEQGLVGRLFDYGSVIVTGTGSTMEPIPFISAPIKFRQAVQEATDQAPASAQRTAA